MFPRLPPGRAVLVLDVLVVLWIVVFLLLGDAVADAVRELTALSGTVERVGGAVDEAGRSIGSVDAPFIGGGFDQAGERLSEAGRGITREGLDTRATIDRAADLLGFAVAAIPIFPALLVYVPPRLLRARETQALRRVLARDGDDPLLERFLAQRAVSSLPYRTLLQVSDRPWRDAEEGPYDRLAAEELRRLGLSSKRLQGARRVR